MSTQNREKGTEAVPQLESLHCHNTLGSGLLLPRHKPRVGGPRAQKWHHGTGLGRGRSTQPGAACGRARMSSPTLPGLLPVGCWLGRNRTVWIQWGRMHLGPLFCEAHLFGGVRPVPLPHWLEAPGESVSSPAAVGPD